MAPPLEHTVNWLSVVVSAAVGGFFGAGFFGYISARVQEFQKNRRRLRALAGALSQDCQRIRGELGEPSDKFVEELDFGAGRAPLTVHPWTVRLIADAAEISPALVGEYMTLEHALQNFSAFRATLRESLSAIANLEEGRRRAEQEGAAGVTSLVRVRQLMTETQGIAKVRSGVVVTARREAWAALAEIDRLLSPYK
jgi:hypothetical protein